MKLKHMLMAGLSAGLLSCSGGGQTTQTEQDMNPFFSKYDTPFEVPPFELIKEEHYKPAFTAGFEEHNKEIDAIANATEPATFANTIVALDEAGGLLRKVSSVFNNLNSANTNDQLQAIATEIAPIRSAHYDNIQLNKPLFERVQKVWNERESLGLTTEQMQLLDRTYKSFVRSGAQLGEKEKERLKEINSRLSVLTVKFSQNALAETNDFKLVIEKQEDLAGLPAGVVQAAAAAATKAGMEGKWVFGLQNASVMPFLQYAENRELRKQIWEAYKNRGNRGNDKDNNELVREIVALRAERSALLGYKTHADFVLEERMAKNTENVYQLLNQLWGPAVASARKEQAMFQEMVKKEGKNFEIEPYDWRYYEEKVRKEKFSLDAQEVAPYFSLPNVREGIFTVTEKLFGLKFKQLTNMPVYHPEVEVFEAIDADGSHVGVLYMDMHPRASKRGGAWMTSFRQQAMENGARKAPVISIVCNFTPPSGDTPSLLTFDEVSTFFHEFGHALHGLLSNVNYQGLAGTSVPTDFVELPSQIMENWAAEPEVMKMFARHYQTGEVIPDELIQRLENSGTYGQGFATVEYLASSFLDLSYHTRTNGFEGSAEAFEKEAMEKIGLPASIIPRHRSNYFSHIFAGGYSAGYYSYIWSGVLDTDAFQAFKTTDLFNQEKATAFRKNILEAGGTDDPMAMYVRFRGAPPTIDALLKKRGLTPITGASSRR